MYTFKRYKLDAILQQINKEGAKTISIANADTESNRAYGTDIWSRRLMPLTLGFLQTLNTLLLLASGWIYWKDPELLNSQALLYTSLLGLSLACITLLLLSIITLIKAEVRWPSFIANIFLGLLFTTGQGYCLYWLSRENGLWDVIQRLVKHFA